MGNRDVLLAAVIGAQGLKGEVKAKLFTAAPDALPRFGVLHTRDGRKLKITAFRPTKEGEAVIAFEDVRDRSQAEALKGTELFVDRAALPQTDEDEFYHADLIGRPAVLRIAAVRINRRAPIGPSSRYIIPK